MKGRRLAGDTPRGDPHPPGGAEPYSAGVDGSARRSIVAASLCADYSPDAVTAALEQALGVLGGLPRFVPPGATVLLKPNLLSPRPPGEAVTTHPAVVAALVRLCLQAGAARVWVGDSPAGDHDEGRLWRDTGMAEAVPAAGGEMRSLRGAVTPTRCGNRSVPVPAWLPEVDVLISVPKLKTHMLTLLTGAVKNVYGLIPGRSKSLFHGEFPSPRRMAGFLTEVFGVFRPALSVMDAVVALEGDGPANGSPVSVGVLLASTDAVALDACCAPLLGLTPAQVPLIAGPAARGLGIAEPARIDLLGDGADRLRAARLRRSRGRALQHLPEWAFRACTWMLTYRPEIHPGLCTRCGICAETCSRSAIVRDAKGRYRIHRAACILCLCCLESCPHHAIRVRSPLLVLLRFWRWLQERRPPQEGA
ncbi:MAG: DUF362 domain-containing protein [Lentisphaeria bacterium]|nr:DUF362 domain-containing protein [Lentisphaeria bacterium]